MTATHEREENAAANQVSRCPMASGPKGLPVIGDAPTYFRDPLAYTLRMQADHGSMVTVRLPVPFVQVTEPDAVDRVLRTNPDNYTRGTLYKGFIGYMGKGLLTLNDKEWRSHRKVVQPAFVPQRVLADAGEAVPAAEAMLTRWADVAGSGTPLDIVPDLMDITARVIGTALINRDLSEDGVGYSRAAAIASKVMYTATIFGLNELLPSFLPTRYNREKRWSHKVINGIVRDAIDGRRASGEQRDDALGHLLNSGLSDQEIKDDLRTLLLAGSDTTGQAMSWALYELARHPDVLAEVEEEVDRVLGDRTPTKELLDELPVVRSVIDEALRLHPPVWQFPRDSIEGDVLAGREVPAGTTVLMSTYGTHRSAEHWTDPDAFVPARFRDESGGRAKFAYFPFGGGRRMCIGKGLAIGTLITTIAMVSQRYRLRLVDAEPVGQSGYITLFPTNGVHRVIEERT
jgi:cytochrome P450